MKSKEFKINKNMNKQNLFKISELNKKMNKICDIMKGHLINILYRNT